MVTARWVRTLWVPMICCLSTSCINVISHDEMKAAKAATQFAQAAFVSRDYAEAYRLLAPRAKAQVPVEKLSGTIAEMHPKEYPTRVAAAEFEPMPGQRAMNIFLKGTGVGEDFFYRLVMEGDASSGYGVIGLYRGNGPHPPSNRKPLPK